MPELTLKFKDNVINTYSLEGKKSFSIGRRKTNDLVIENLAVSGSHAKIEASEEGFVLSDLQSKNGTYVNKQPITTYLLKDNDVIRIGMHTLEFSKKKSGGKKNKAK
ncbi:MAG: FHA domain-containing protein [Desulfosudaceae bacterium]